MGECKFEVGDAVEYVTGYGKRIQEGAIGEVVEKGEYGNGESLRVVFGGADFWFRHTNFTLKPATFPVPAEKDPWKTSERDHSDSESPCGECSGSHGQVICTRAELHAGHHVARDDEGVVYARWKNDSAEAVKPGVPDVMCLCGDWKPKGSACKRCNSVKWDGGTVNGVRIVADPAMSPNHPPIAVCLPEKQRAASYSPSASCSDCAKLKRELENLTRRHQSTFADQQANIALFAANKVELETENAFLKRELERLRKRKP